LVWDFEPGTVTVACTGAVARGAVHVVTATSSPVAAFGHHGRHVWAVCSHY
jgi:hypothetical protein